jgi:hypothetical protein
MGLGISLVGDFPRGQPDGDLVKQARYGKELSEEYNTGYF